MAGYLSNDTTVLSNLSLTGRVQAASLFGANLSLRTVAASAITVSAANTNVRPDEVVFTIGGASGASLAINSGGTLYFFNSAGSAALA